MRGNRPARERFDFSLDARQVASVLLGSLAALGITFFLGYSLGQRALERPVRPHGPAGAPVPAPADPLAALDQPTRPDAGEPAHKLSFHEALTASKPPAAEKLPPPPRAPPAPPAPPAAAVAAAAAAARPPDPKAAAEARSPPEARPAEARTPAATPADPRPSAEPRPPVAATEAKTAADPAAAASVPPASAGRPAAPAPAKGSAPAPAAPGAFALQVGSTQDRFEAERLAGRFRARGARVVESDVPGKGRWYRVKVGSYETREAAERALRELERSGAKGFVTGGN